jgi:hypothetical protein
VATLTWTIAKGGYAGTSLRALARELVAIAGDFPDQNPTGASVTLTIDNAPATGSLSVASASTGGPYGPATTRIVG